MTTLNGIYYDIAAERAAAEEKHGIQRDLSPYHWLTILMEEVGEAAKAAWERDWPNYREELIQVAAVAVGMIAAFDSQQPSLTCNTHDDTDCQVCLPEEW